MAQHSYMCVVICKKVHQKLIVLLSFLNTAFNSIFLIVSWVKDFNVFYFYLTSNQLLTSQIISSFNFLLDIAHQQGMVSKNGTCLSGFLYSRYLSRFFVIDQHSKLACNYA